ncbi:MAG TPA: hypothetical protein VF550_11515 [Polyangia bacterium]
MNLDRVNRATLDALIERFPEEWEIVGQNLVAATASHRPQDIEAFVLRAREEAAPWQRRVQKSHKNPKVLAGAMPSIVRARMAFLAAQSAVQAAAMGGATGRVRFGLWSGYLVQKLFFSHGLVRKPVSLRAFRRWWPWVTQKRLLMPLVEPRGIYAFYSRELIHALAARIGERPCLEIAAGDGTLTRFLAGAGVHMRATDNHSWSHAIQFPEEVEKLEARQAMERYQPKVVVCSFPPPRNTFEREVFRTSSVDLYVVLTTRHKFAAGDWSAYESQTDFELQSDLGLDRLLLPSMIDPQVLVFERKPSPPSARGAD